MIIIYNIYIYIYIHGSVDKSKNQVDYHLNHVLQRFRAKYSSSVKLACK